VLLYTVAGEKDEADAVVSRFLFISCNFQGTPSLLLVMTLLTLIIRFWVSRLAEAVEATGSFGAGGRFLLIMDIKQQFIISHPAKGTQDSRRLPATMPRRPRRRKKEGGRRMEDELRF